MRKMQDLEEMAANLLEVARKIPPGPDRHESLKEIGRFRMRVAEIQARFERLQPNV